MVPWPGTQWGREKDIRIFLQLSKFNESCSNLNLSALSVRSTVAVIVPKFLVSSKIIQLILVLALLSLLLPNVWQFFKLIDLVNQDGVSTADSHMMLADNYTTGRNHRKSAWTRKLAAFSVSFSELSHCFLAWFCAGPIRCLRCQLEGLDKRANDNCFQLEPLDIKMCPKSPEDCWSNSLGQCLNFKLLGITYLVSSENKVQTFISGSIR